MQNKTVFYLIGDIFTGKSYFARLYSARQGVIPLSINLQLAQQNIASIDEFIAAINRAKEEQTKSCVIFDDVDKNIELWLNLARHLNDLRIPVAVFIICNEKKLEVFKGIKLNEWDILEIQFTRLKNRPEDIIPLLCSMYQNFHSHDLTITEEAQKLLELYDWPHNLLDVQQLAREHSSNVMSIQSIPESFFDVDFHCEFVSNNLKLDPKSSFIWKCKLARLQQDSTNIETLALRLNLSPRSVRFLKALSA